MIDEFKTMEDIAENFCNDCSACAGSCRIEDIFDIIRKQPKVNEWISVEERLPEVGQSVLATENEEVFFCTYEYFYGHGRGFYPSYGNVTAWMPLPEPFDMRKKVE